MGYYWLQEPRLRLVLTTSWTKRDNHGLMFWLGLLVEQVTVDQWSSHKKGSNRSRTEKQWSFKFVYLEFKRKTLLLHWHFQNKEMIDKELDIYKVRQIYHHVSRSKSSRLNKSTKPRETWRLAITWRYPKQNNNYKKNIHYYIMLHCHTLDTFFKTYYSHHDFINISPLMPPYC